MCADGVSGSEVAQYPAAANPDVLPYPIEMTAAVNPVEVINAFYVFLFLLFFKKRLNFFSMFVNLKILKKIVKNFEQHF